MWPINRKLGLRNLYTKQLEAPASIQGDRAITKPQAPDFLQLIVAIDVRTPESSKDINRLKEILISIDPTFENPTAHLLFKKMGKALDDWDIKLTATENHKNQLMAALEKAGPKKRRKVEPDPNQEFVTLKDVRIVKEGLQEPPTGPDVVTPQNEAEEEEENETIVMTLSV